MGLIVDMPESLIESDMDPFSLYHSIPKALLVMSIFSKIFNRLNPSSQKTVDYNTLMQLFLHDSLRLFSLACFENRVHLSRLKHNIPAVKNHETIYRFIKQADPMDSAPLGTQIRTFCQNLPLEEKLIFMDDIGRILRQTSFLPDPLRR